MNNILVRLWRRLPSVQQQTACTIQLPHELIANILRYLPPESVIALALTCRALFVQFFPRPAPLSDGEKEILLQYLERDFPKLYYCHDCIRLHKWRLIKSFDCTTVSLPPCWDRVGSKNLMTDYVPGHGLYIAYFFARLVMNRHFYGSAHGPSVKDMAVTQPSGKALSEVGMSRSWRTKIINDNLYLHGKLLYRSLSKTKTNKSELLERFLQFVGHCLICPHLEPPSKYPPSVPIIPELVLEGETAGELGPTPGKTRSCTVCFTDYRIRVTWRDDAGCGMWRSGGDGWVIEVERWQRLGRCRSPHDSEWRNLMTPYLDRTAVQRKDVCAPGVIRREWMGAEAGPVEEDVAALVPAIPSLTRYSVRSDSAVTDAHFRIGSRVEL